MVLCKDTTATILFGPTQYGKSTFLDKILHKNEEVRPKMGTGKGHSITRTSHLYRATLIGPVVDIPGTNDTGLLVDASLIAKQVALLLTTEDISNVRFLLFDSLGESSVQIRPSIEQLVQAFGVRVKDSIVVVACKLDRADEDEIEDRIETMEATMEECKIGRRLVTWKNKKLSHKEWQDQLEELSLALDETKRTTLTDIQDLKSRVIERAKKLHEEQEPEMREHEFEDMENRVVERVETEKYRETEWERVKVANSNMMIDKNFAAGVATYALSFGIGWAIDGALHGGKPVYEMHPKKVTKHRQVTHYDNVEVKVTKTTLVPHWKPLSDFMEIARAEILRETRQALTASSPSK